MGGRGWGCWEVVRMVSIDRNIIRRRSSRGLVIMGCRWDVFSDKWVGNYKLEGLILFFNSVWTFIY